MTLRASRRGRDVIGRFCATGLIRRKRRRCGMATIALAGRRMVLVYGGQRSRVTARDGRGRKHALIDRRFVADRKSVV